MPPPATAAAAAALACAIAAATMGATLASPSASSSSASLLQLPHTGFIAADDPRMLGTVSRIEQDLVDEHGFVARYRTASGSDGLAGGEYPFLLCLAWLAEQYARSGRVEDGRGALDHRNRRRSARFV